MVNPVRMTNDVLWIDILTSILSLETNRHLWRLLSQTFGKQHSDTHTSINTVINTDTDTESEAMPVFHQAELSDISCAF